MSKLVIVESPTKAKTLTKILGKEYIIEASMGHIRDLPTKKLGVDIDDNYKPDYEVPDKAKKHLSKLKKALKDVDTVVLATDPDREGEAIAWHLKEILNSVKGAKKKKYERVVFHEITKAAIEDAFSHATTLNMDLVDAQQARRVLDRLVGYTLSPLLWKKVRYGLSAGRVQSVAVRLVVERERERDAFESVEYWSIKGEFENASKSKFTAVLSHAQGKKINITDKSSAQEHLNTLEASTYKVKEIKRSERVRRPQAPFKTSTLQQVAANTFSMSARNTMSAAQKLFEKGLITYHRSDSLTLSTEFVSSARTYIAQELGQDFLPEHPQVYKTKSKNAQEAHEAIRPTDISKNPKLIQSLKLSEDEQKVYTIIYKRSLECQVKSAVYDQTTVNVISNNDYIFSASGSIIKFSGWLEISKLIGFSEERSEVTLLPELEEGEDLKLLNLLPEQHFTQPPARYSDASLIKYLEEMGIGRPSTYAPTISTILARKYVRRDGRYFAPEDVAYVVTDLLVDHINTVVDYSFTADMEAQFDEIANGKKSWVPVIKTFFEPFSKNVKEKDKELQKTDVTNLGISDEVCPDCGKQLNFKLGKYGKFLSCSGFPECEYAKPLAENQPLDADGNIIADFGKCEVCSTGVMLLKQGKFGKFLACSDYPKCKTTKPYLDKIGMVCPKCKSGEVIVKKAKGRVFYGCSNYPTCDYASWKNPIESTSNPSNDTNTDSITELN